MWRASAELKQRAVEVCAGAKKHSGHYIEFWKDIPEHEPYRVVLGEVRDKLWNTRDHIQHLMARGHSEFSPQDIYTDPEQLMGPGAVLQVAVLGGRCSHSRQQAARHATPGGMFWAVAAAPGAGRVQPVAGAAAPGLAHARVAEPPPAVWEDLVEAASGEVREVLATFRTLAGLPRDSLGAYVISMATRRSHVLEVQLLQRAAGVKRPLRVVPLFERLDDLSNAPAVPGAALQPAAVPRVAGGRRAGDHDRVLRLGKDAGRLGAAWALYKAQARVVEPPGTVNGGLRVTVQGEVIEQSFGEEHLCFRTLQRFTAATLDHTLNPPCVPLPQWEALMERMAPLSTAEYRSVVFQHPRFVELFRSVTPRPSSPA
ncbi:hypothetical protein CLOM_g14568 [Closterium sp. NIES-68]|nr:hypothetical protein CLOM_g14568 [Closterium sp. NIES-68]